VRDVIDPDPRFECVETADVTAFFRVVG
jgi:hypothetical protein